MNRFLTQIMNSCQGQDLSSTPWKEFHTPPLPPVTYSSLGSGQLYGTVCSDYNLSIWHNTPYRPSPQCPLTSQQARGGAGPQGAGNSSCDYHSSDVNKLPFSLFFALFGYCLFTSCTVHLVEAYNILGKSALVCGSVFFLSLCYFKKKKKLP